MIKNWCLFGCCLVCICCAGVSSTGQTPNPIEAGPDDHAFRIVRNTVDLLLSDYSHPLTASDLFLEAVRGVIDLKGMDNSFMTRGIHIQAITDRLAKALSPDMTSNVAVEELKRLHMLCKSKNPHITSREISERMVDSMLKSLDGRSALIRPDSYKAMRTGTELKSYGIGIWIGLKDGGITVISALENSPAYKAGVMSGDIIIEIDGRPVDTLKDAINRISGPKRSRVAVTIQRNGDQNPLKFDIERNDIPAESVISADLGNNVLYIRISQFRKNTSLEFENIFNKHTRENGIPSGLVIDLRGNPGGLLKPAIEISEFLLGEGDILKIKRSKRKDTIFRAKRNLKFTFPIVTLVNRGTASSAEILTAALRDHHRSLTVGRTSYGKGSIYTIQPLADGYALRFMIGRYASPNGYTWDDKGIYPDVVSDDEKYLRWYTKEYRDRYLPQNLKTSALIKLGMTLLNNSSDYFGIGDKLAVKIAQKAASANRKDEPNPSKQNLYVLAIGVSNYSQTDFKLKHASRDALRFANVFRNQSPKVFDSVYTKVLTDAEVTRRNVLDAINSFLTRASTKDIVIIFVAGHGIKRRITDTYYFLTYDATHVTLTQSAIRWSDFEEELKMLQSQVEHIVIVLDTCHSAALDTSIRGNRLGTNLSASLEKKGYSVLAASRENESALEKDELQHGVFTYTILDGLKGKADYNNDHLIDLEELFSFVEHSVSTLTNGFQHPHFTSSEKSLTIYALKERLYRH